MRALQHAVIEALRNGAELSTVHKEGGTVIHHDGTTFVAADFGERPHTRRLSTEGELLDFVWRHFEFENTRDAAPGSLTPALGWRSIHERLTTRSLQAASKPKGRRVGVWAAAIGTLALAAVLGSLKYDRKAQAVQAEAGPVIQQKVGPPPPQVTQPAQRATPPGASSGARP